MAAKKTAGSAAGKTALEPQAAAPGPAKGAKRAAAASSTASAQTVTAAKAARKSKQPRPEPEALAEITASGAETSSELVDQQLARYRDMRDFGITAEPSGNLAKAERRSPARSANPAEGAAGLPFVIQKHAASHLHYDFRLGWSGVLKSWACAKGPSYHTGDRRLAVQVEDHPIEYGGFEGIIPQGQYGGGTVMVWDQGTWWPQLGHEDVDAGLRTGSLKFEMHGTKMRGKWTLVRMNEHAGGDKGKGRWSKSDKPNWLLIKEHDEFEQPQTAPPVTEQEPRSALTGRTLEEIARQEDHVWNSKETAGTGQAWFRQDPGPVTAAPPKKAPAVAPPEPKAAATQLPGLTKLPKESQPEFIEPQLAQETEAPPEGAGWLHELKLDGYRMQARKSGRGVQMLTRSGLDWTYRVPSVAEAVARLPVKNITLDGEVVVLAADGTTNFADLQASFQQGAKNPLTFFCFDLLHLEGHNPRDRPLRERKKMLASFIAPDEKAIVRLSEHLETDGGVMFRQACELHAEGIVSKRSDVPYRAGRNGDWLKSKCLHEQEFVVGGFTFSSDGPDRIGSLLIGYYREGQLIYAGRTGTGFTQRTRRDLRIQLSSLELKANPFAAVPAEARRGALWVRPELVAQVRFATWTAEDLVRQAAFLGLREDKPATEVVREAATAPPQRKGSGHSRSKTGKATAPPDESPAEQGPATSAPAKPGPAGKKSAVAKNNPAPPLRLTHPEKVLDPVSGLTKRRLAEYYWAVAARMLPHIANRPLSLVRCPDGADKPCFYQKHVNHMLPPGVGSVDVPDKKTGVIEPYITLATPEALTGLAQMGVLEVHPWGSHNDDLEHPDRLIFDLDPDEDLPWSTVAEAALDVRARLQGLGLESFLKTTGGKGLHIVAPILPELDFAQLKDTAHHFVLGMERANPRLYLTKMTKAARKGKIYLDYLRNERGATAVAPFSPRARPGVNVSVPLEWEELKGGQRPDFSVSNFESWDNRLARDPWKRLMTLRQSLDPKLVRSL